MLTRERYSSSSLISSSSNIDSCSSSSGTIVRLSQTLNINR